MKNGLAQYGSQLAQFSSIAVITRLVVLVEAFIALKIFTNLLSVSEYGLYELSYSLAIMISFISSGGFPQSINRYIIRFDSRNKTKVANDLFYTALITVFLINFALLIFLFGSFYANLELIDSPNYFTLLIGIGLLAVFMGSNHLLIGLVRARQLVKWYAILFVLKAFIGLVLEIILVFFLKFQVFGMLLGLSGGEACGFFLFFIWLFRERAFGHFSKHRLMELLKFGLPLTISQAIGTSINFLIAFLIFSYASSEELAYFALGNSVSSLINILIIGITTAYNPIIGKLYEQGLKDSLTSFTNIVLRFYLVLSIPFILFLTSLAPILIVLFSNENYLPGAVVVPYILISLFFTPLTTITTQGGFLKYRMDLVTIVYAIAAGITILFAFLIIPIYGIIGASIVLIIQAVLHFIFKFALSQYLYKIEFEIRRLGKIIIAIVPGVLLLLFLNSVSLFGAFCAILIFIFLIFFLKGLTISEFKSAVGLLLSQTKVNRTR